MNEKNETAVITGASKGIGEAIAKEFARQEYKLALISRNISELEKTAERIQNERLEIGLPDAKIKCYACDVSNKNQAEETFKKIHDDLKTIDVLINNAGINSRKTLNPKDKEKWFENFETNLKGWQNEIDTNLTGAYMCAYLASGYMIKDKREGRIINISSIKGKEPTSSPGYGASKAGIIKLTRDFAKTLAPYGIRVNCIAPGFINTGMTTELSAEKQQEYKKMIAMQRFGTVEEVAKAAKFLASKDASYITGITLDVNGGYLMY